MVREHYETQVSIPLPDGRKLRKHIRAGSRRELEQKKKQILREAEQGVDLFQDDRFGTWSNQWLETTKLHQGLSDGLEIAYLSEVAGLNRQFGDLRFQRLTLYRLQHAMNEFAACNPTTGQPTSASTLRKYRFVAANIARFASGSGVRGVNVSAFESVQIPRNAPVRKRPALTPEQIRMVERTEHPMQPFTMLATFAGLRRGEALGLQWRDLDLPRSLLHVRRTLLFSGGHAVLKDGGKTANAVRTVCLPPVLTEYLQRYRDDMPVIPAPTCFVVTNKQGRPFCESTFRRYWKDYQQTLNLRYGEFDHNEIRDGDPVPEKIEPFTPHQCRHTFATLLYLEDVGVADSMSLMGHADPSTTLAIYTDLQHFHKSELPDWFRQNLQTSYRVDLHGIPRPARESWQ